MSEDLIFPHQFGFPSPLPSSSFLVKLLSHKCFSFIKPLSYRGLFFVIITFTVAVAIDPVSLFVHLAPLTDVVTTDYAISSPFVFVVFETIPSGRS